MKKTYMIPAMKSEEAQAVQMMAVSIIQGGTADDSEVLIKENNLWNIWEDN